ncbi:PREDICTED: trihelix transcription factor GTL1-like isoform X2 [Trachymyrmex septentrionalis]|uniref:trihelix transcription factor GTL1-like isoform X2 n=1 Tax=Trachymyrmex septentrionalis TaxID=34720 RepID=UPI00084F43E7|nr:PREDICTED: trihelix transcription factor GTL1-like isoform X2 [Trachymyrmex septentrionalis]
MDQLEERSLQTDQLKNASKRLQHHVDHRIHRNVIKVYEAAENMADNSNEMKKTIFLKNIESEEVYTILLTEEEAKCLGADNNISEINHAESLHSDHSDKVGVFKWPHKAILLLIEEYNLRQEDFNGKMSHKKIWSLIADKLKKHGYNVTGLQCLSKFTGLKRTYNGIKESNRKPKSIVWPYFSNMDELLHSKSCTLPLSTTVSSIERKQKSRQMSTIEEYMEDLQNGRKISEEAIERRHKENIELHHRLLNSFEKMLDILEKKMKC